MLTFEEQLKEATSLYEAQKAAGIGGQQSIIEAALQMFTVALKLWLNKESTRYTDEKMKLLNEWNEEYNKSPHDRMELDKIQDKLNILQLAFISAVNNSAASAAGTAGTT